MKIEQRLWTRATGWEPALLGELGASAQLVLAFGSRSALTEPGLLEAVRAAYPEAAIAGCSTAGEIHDIRATDDSLTLAAIAFDGSTACGVQVDVPAPDASYEAALTAVQALPAEGLAHVFLLSDGLNANGSELVRGALAGLPPSVGVTGGLSGDGDRFEETLVLWNGELKARSLVALGFYGDRLTVGYGSWGGWDAFGPDRLVTQSRGNVVYTLDGKPALELYKQYLGDYADGLPATGLLFPLSLRPKTGEGAGLTRTILAVDEAAGSLTFAGDVPEGATVRLMKANLDRLVDGAMEAAENGQQAVGDPDLALCISCVGRKLVLKQRVEEEVEGVREIVGDRPAIFGFYSYGEIAPFAPGATCALHNQTMTVTLLGEQ